MLFRSAAPPPGVLTDSDWVRFGQRMGIDLRRAPYSFLALERKGLRPTEEKFSGWSRVVGAPRVYKGFAKLFACQAEGVRDVTLQKRDAKDVFKRLNDDEPVWLAKGELANEKLVAVSATLP